MLHKISEKTQRVSRLNPKYKIDYWVNFIDIDRANGILYVTSRTLDSHDSLRHSITSHMCILHAEDVSVTFLVKEDEDNLQFVFSNNIKASLDFLSEEMALSSELYNQAINYLNTNKISEEKSFELSIPSNTIQTSLSDSNGLFSNKSLPETPLVLTAEVKSYRA